MSKEPLRWSLPPNVFERTEEHPQFNTCTHRMDNVVLVKDTENLAVFWDARRNIMHYSLQLREWFSCQTVGVKTYEKWLDEPHLEMQYIQERVKSLKSLHQM